MAVNDGYKIFVDATQPATLNDGAGSLTDCSTLQEAVLAWHRLAPEQKMRATVKVIGGRVYTAQEIARLHYGSKARVTPHNDTVSLPLPKHRSDRAGPFH